jgi:hypothetical protein
MDYEKMKALMEASREESAVQQRNLQAKEFPKLESRPNWKYLDAAARERKAA